MVKILLADDNLIFCKELINSLDNQHTKVCKLCTSGKEVLNVLDELEVDIIVLDIYMPQYNGIDVLEKLSREQKERYAQSIIVISGDNGFVPQLLCNPLIYDYIIKGTNQNEVVARINRLVKSKNILKKKKEIINELAKIGYDVNYKGITYLVSSILYLHMNQEKWMDNLKRDVYPVIAKIYNTTPHNIKCNINNATESMYCKCASKVLREYFNFFDDTKPTVKMVIYTVLNKIA